MKHREDKVYCAITGRRISDDGKVIDLWPGIRQPIPIDDYVAPADDDAASVDHMTFKSDLGSYTVDDICDFSAAAETADLRARFDKSAERDLPNYVEEDI